MHRSELSSSHVTARPVGSRARERGIGRKAAGPFAYEVAIGLVCAMCSWFTRYNIVDAGDEDRGGTAYCGRRRQRPSHQNCGPTGS